MKVTVTGMYGFADAFVAMYISKRTWTPELDQEIRGTCYRVLDSRGRISNHCSQEDLDKFNKWLTMVLKIGKNHITLLRFINFSIMTEGLHRAGQDDVDAHAKRFENRIIRSSTRLATFGNEMSDYYRGKIIPTDEAMKILGIQGPEEFEYNGRKYVKSTNGYILENLKDNKDVKRGLYMLSIPSNFVSQINLTEFAHVYKERNANGSANPEVKEWAETVADELISFHENINRELLLAIKN